MRGVIDYSLNASMATVASYDHDRGEFSLQGTVDIGEAFNVKHVYDIISSQ